VPKKLKSIAPNLAIELKEQTSLPRIKTPELQGIKIEGEYVIWPSGLRTHLRFIKEAVMKRRNLPVGFYAEVDRLNLPNLSNLARRAKSLGLKDNVGK
jgi:hypothetical protein